MALEQEGSPAGLLQRHLDDFARVVDSCLWETDADLRIIWISERANDVLGRPTRSVRGLDLLELLHLPVTSATAELFFRHLPVRGIRCAVRTGRGRTPVSLVVSAVPVFSPGCNRFTGYRGSLTCCDHDVVADPGTPLGRLARTFGSSLLPVMITDEDGRIVYVNPRFEVLTGFTAAEILGETPSILGAGQALADDYQRLWQALATGTTWRGDMCLRRRDGRPLWLAQTISPIHGADGRISHMLAIGEEVMPRHLYQQWLLHQARHDELTGLPNRLGFLDRLPAAIAEARRGGHGLALLFIDLDHFRFISDALGPTGGDDVLRQIGHRLRAATAETDMVARLASDEFVVGLVDCGDRWHIDGAVGRLATTLAEPITIGGQDISIHASIGIALFPEDGDDEYALLKNADTAMHWAKETGGNTHQFFAPAMDDKARPFIALGQSLRQALPRRQFELFYQPVIELTSGRLVGAEALLRWNHPELGLVPPATFIGLAEESGLIQGIGDWVLQEALRQTRQWLDDGLDLPRIAVNVSARQLQRGRLLASIVTALAGADLPPSTLCIEITESTVVADAGTAQATLEELSELGIALAIDDFGTGYSWLTYLRQLPIDVLKIDKAFIRDLAIDADAAAIVDAIIAMAHRLGLRVVAEGVRDERQIELLRQKGCEMLQGYFFSPPVTANEFARLLRSRRHFLLQPTYGPSRNGGDGSWRADPEPATGHLCARRNGRRVSDLERGEAADAG
jgi:diguanylate cyclase (GGDEF)-like protein/PAS domain S-box-containing protein